METRLHTNRPEPPLPLAEEAWPIEAGSPPLYGEAPPPGGFGAILRPLIYGVVGLCCAGGLWYAYQHSRLAPAGTADVPLIRADQSAAKVRPDQPGGEPVPDQDKLVYNPSQAAPKIERLLPPPERPLAKPVPSAETPNAPNPADTEVSAPLPVQNIASIAEPKSAPPTPPSAILPAASSSGVLVAPASETPPAPPPASSASGASKPAPPIALTAPSKATPISPAPTDAAVAVNAAPAAKPAGAGSYRVQIGASRDEAQARAEGEKLQKAHPDLLGQLTPVVVKADLGDKGIYYRVQAGPVADHDKAEKLCQALKQFSIACIIVKP